MWPGPVEPLEDVSADGISADDAGTGIAAPDAGPAIPDVGDDMTEDPAEDRWPCSMGETSPCICDNGTEGEASCLADPASPQDGFFSEECTICSEVVAGDCTDGTVSGQETDVDCGGPECPGCGVGLACNSSMDCEGMSTCGNSVCLGEGGTTDPNAVASCAGQPDGTACTTPLLPCSAGTGAACFLGLCGCT